MAGVVKLKNDYIYTRNIISASARGTLSRTNKYIVEIYYASTTKVIEFETKEEAENLVSALAEAEISGTLIIING